MDGLSFTWATIMVVVVAVVIKVVMMLMMLTRGSEVPDDSIARERISGKVKS